MNTEALENELIAYRYSLAYTPQVDEAIKSLRNMDISDRHSQELITSLAKITLTETVAGVGLQKLLENHHKEGIDALSSELQELGFNNGSSGLDKDVHSAIKQRGEEISVTINGPITALLQYGRHHIAEGLYNQKGAEISINMKSSVDNQIESLIEHSTHTLVHEMVHLTSDSNALVSDLGNILEKTPPVNKLPSDPSEMIRMQTLLYKDNTKVVSTGFYEAIVESFTQKTVADRMEINYPGVDDSYPRERTALEKTIDAYNVTANEPLDNKDFVQTMYRGYANDGVSLESLLYPTETQTGLEPSQLPKTLFPEPRAFFDFINRFATELDLELRRNNDGSLDDYRIKMNY